MRKIQYFNGSTKPYVRWWWLNGPFNEADMIYQLDWLRENGFGGVEFAWLAPNWLGVEVSQPRWLSEEWSERMALPRQLAGERGLGCDFTLGSCWPFGGDHVVESAAAQTFDGLSPQRLYGSWEDHEQQNCHVVNHLSSQALQKYASPILNALQDCIQEGKSALFCDSLEVDTQNLWDKELWEVFEDRFGYRLQAFTHDLDSFSDVRYDYRKLIAETMTREFYREFTEICHAAGTYSRVQCHGSLTDLLASYGVIDVPESEALLFNPYFSRIPASAAALTGKPVVSAEAFTCIYGFSHYRDPSLYPLWKKEDVNDLRLLADAIIANGVNQIVWHGMPYNPEAGNNEFYAAVHVGPDSGFADHLNEFNGYLSHLCSLMQKGMAYSQLAVYLPNEDNWMADRIPDHEKTPGATYRWQMRHVAVPDETEGFHPIWISASYLPESTVEDGKLRINDLVLDALYIDCKWLDREALPEVLRLACSGLPIVLKAKPQQPGKVSDRRYHEQLAQLLELPVCFSSIQQLGLQPLVNGNQLPLYWARETSNEILVFLAHPAAREISFPMKFQQSAEAVPGQMKLRFCWREYQQEIVVDFPRYGSRLLRLGFDGQCEFIELGL